MYNFLCLPDTNEMILDGCTALRFFYVGGDDITQLRLNFLNRCSGGSDVKSLNLDDSRFSTLLRCVEDEIWIPDGKVLEAGYHQELLANPIMPALHLLEQAILKN